MLLTTGCRLSEARRMQPQHVNMKTGAWLQPHTKNGKPHTTYLPVQTRAALGALPHSRAYFFDGMKGQCYSLASAEKAWTKEREALELKDVRLHDFRRTWSTHTYRATKDLSLVKHCMNHVDPSVTMIYIRFMFEDVAIMMQAPADRFFALQAGPVPVALPAPTQRAMAPLLSVRRSQTRDDRMTTLGRRQFIQQLIDAELDEVSILRRGREWLRRRERNPWPLSQ